MNDRPPPTVLGSLWRYRWMSAAIVIVVTGLSVVISVGIQPEAQAVTTIALVTPPSNSVLAPGAASDTSLGRYTAQRAAFVTSDAVLGAAAKELGRDDLTALRADITVKPSTSANTVKIVAKAKSDAEAVRVADAIVAAYRQETRQDVARLTDAAVKSLNESAATIRATTVPGSESATANTLSQLAIKASEIRTSSALYGDGVEFVVAARDDAVALRSISLRDLVLGLALGLVAAATAAWIRADNADRPRRAPAQSSGSPVAAVPEPSQPRARLANQPVPVPEARWPVRD